MFYIEDSTSKKYMINNLFDENRSRISYGNTKTGIPSINTLAGDKTDIYNGCIPAPLKDFIQKNHVCGTCTGNCPGCYAKKITRNIAPTIKYMLNTLEAKKDPQHFWFLVNKELYSNPIITYKVVRIHDSGDFFNADYLKECFKFTNKHKQETRFGAYSKEEKLLTEYGIDRIEKEHDNVSLSCSPWPGFCNPIGNLPQFILDDGTDSEIAKLPHCPAVDKNGKRTGVKCCDCLHCYFAKAGDKRAVYLH